MPTSVQLLLAAVLLAAASWQLAAAVRPHRWLRPSEHTMRSRTVFTPPRWAVVGLPTITAGLLAVTITLAGFAPTATPGWHLPTVDVDMTVDPDGDVQVVERYQVAGDPNGYTGIDRTIPVRRFSDGQTDQVVQVTDLQATGNGRPLSVSAAAEGNDLAIHAAAEHPAEGGPEVVELHYTLEGAVAVDGNQATLQVPTVTAPDHAAVGVLNVRVFGPAPTDAVCRPTDGCVRSSDTSAMRSWKAAPLAAGQAVAVTARWDIDDVRPGPTTTVSSDANLPTWMLLGGSSTRHDLARPIAAGATVLAGLFLIPPLRRGRAERRASRSGAAAPPRRLEPAMGRYLLDREVTPRLLAAQAVQLASAGHLKVATNPARPGTYLLQAAHTRVGELTGEQRRLRDVLLDGREHRTITPTSTITFDRANVRADLSRHAWACGWAPGLPQATANRWRLGGLLLAGGGAACVLAGWPLWPAAAAAALVPAGLLLFAASELLPTLTRDGLRAARQAGGFTSTLSGPWLTTANRKVITAALPWAVAAGQTGTFAATCPPEELAEATGWLDTAGRPTRTVLDDFCGLLEAVIRLR